MPSGVTLDPGSGGAIVAVDPVVDVATTYNYSLVQLVTGAAGAAKSLVTGSNGIPVSVLGTVPVSGTFWQATQPVSGPLTDAELRATAVPVSGTFFQATQPVSIAATVAVSGPLTDAQLRAVAVPVSGTVAVSSVGGSVAVTGTFWQATQPVSLASVPSHDVTNAGTFLVQAAQSGTWNVSTVTAVTSITNPVAVTGTFFQATQPVSLASVPTHAVTQSGTWNIAAVTAVASVLEVVEVTDVGAVAVVDVVTAVTSITNPVAVTGTFWQATQPVSIAATVTVDSELPAAAAMSDTFANPTSPAVQAMNTLYNESTWERERANTEGTALASGARVASTNSADLTNYSSRGVIAWIDVTANPGAQTLTVLIQGKDGTGNYYTLNGAGIAIAAANAKLGIEVYPGSSSAPGGAGQNRIIDRTASVLPRTWRVSVTHSGASSWTYSVTYSLVR